MAEPSILCIVGDSRSGSTLLQYLLGTQPGVAVVGELRRLGSLLAEGRTCSCGAALAVCERWGPVLRTVGAVANPPRRGAMARRGAEFAGLLARMSRLRPLARAAAPGAAAAADRCIAVYRAVADQERARVLVDSSKDPGHALELALNGSLPVQPIYLLRDGRAVLHSKVRRTGIAPDVAVRHWVRLTRAMLALQRITGGAVVRYEVLCTQPAATISTILRPYDIAVAVSDPPPPAAAQHFLGGSPGFAVASVERLTADQSWRTEAAPELIAAFEKMAGALNRRLGYT